MPIGSVPPPNTFPAPPSSPCRKGPRPSGRGALEGVGGDAEAFPPTPRAERCAARVFPVWTLPESWQGDAFAERNLGVGGGWGETEIPRLRSPGPSPASRLLPCSPGNSTLPRSAGRFVAASREGRRLSADQFISWLSCA